MSDLKVSESFSSKTEPQSRIIFNDIHRTLFKNLEDELSTLVGEKINVITKLARKDEAYVLTVYVYSQKDVTVNALRLAEKTITLFIDDNKEFVIYNKSCELGSDEVIKVIDEFATEYVNKLKVYGKSLEDIKSALS